MKPNCLSILLSFTTRFIIVEALKFSPNRHRFLIISYKIIICNNDVAKFENRNVLDSLSPRSKAFRKWNENHFHLKFPTSRQFNQSEENEIFRDGATHEQNRNSPNDHVTRNKSVRLSRTSTHRFPVRRRRRKGLKKRKRSDNSPGVTSSHKLFSLAPGPASINFTTVRNVRLDRLVF